MNKLLVVVVDVVVVVVVVVVALKPFISGEMLVRWDTLFELVVSMDDMCVYWPSVRDHKLSQTEAPHAARCDATGQVC